MVHFTSTTNTFVLKRLWKDRALVLLFCTDPLSLKLCCFKMVPYFNS